jgi:hypothetical protein
MISKQIHNEHITNPTFCEVVKIKVETRDSRFLLSQLQCLIVNRTWAFSAVSWQPPEREYAEPVGYPHDKGCHNTHKRTTLRKISRCSWGKPVVNSPPVMKGWEWKKCLTRKFGVYWGSRVQHVLAFHYGRCNWWAHWKAKSDEKVCSVTPEYCTNLPQSWTIPSFNQLWS